MPEEWRPIPGWDKYEASNLGRIRSLHGQAPRIMATPPRDGRPVVMLCIRGRRAARQVGVWVLRAFVGDPPEGHECSHKNGDPHDNRIENLAWETHAANMNRKYLHGTVCKGETSGTAKLTERDVELIRRMLELEIPQKMTAWVFRVSQTAISDIGTGRTWTP